MDSVWSVRVIVIVEVICIVILYAIQTHTKFFAPLITLFSSLLSLDSVSLVTLVPQVTQCAVSRQVFVPNVPSAGHISFSHSSISLSLICSSKRCLFFLQSCSNFRCTLLVYPLLLVLSFSVLLPTFSIFLFYRCRNKSDGGGGDGGGGGVYDLVATNWSSDGEENKLGIKLD